MSDITNPHKPQSDVENSVTENDPASEQSEEPVVGGGTSMGPADTQIDNPSTSETEEERHQRRKDRRETISLLLSIAAFCVSFGSCYGSNRAANIAEKALISVQRAFVSLENIQARATQDTQGNVTTWVFQGQWRNSGATPTQTLRQYSNYRWQDQPFPDDYAFPDLESGKSTIAFIAPKDAVFSQRMIVPLGVLREVQERKKHLYFWGWAAYKDVFQGSKTHLSEFCRKLTAIEGDIAKGGNKSAFVFDYCPTRNCVDENCKDYTEVEKKLKGDLP